MDSFHDERYPRDGYGDRQPGRRGPSQREHYGNRPSRRSIDSRQIIDDGRHGLESSRHGDPRRRKSQKPGFRDVINDLHNVLMESLAFYGGFRNTFDRDIQNIKPYAPAGVLDQLWTSKVRMASKRNEDGRGNRDRGSNRKMGGQEPEISFATKASEIAQHIRTAIEASDGVHEPEDKDNARNVFRKLGKTYTDIDMLLKAAPHRRRDADLLLTELELLRTFLSRSGANQGHDEGPSERRNHGESGDQSYDQERAQYDERGFGDEQEED